ncbi:MAG: VWA domain-containing protein, partial [Clostridia bacterium]|nr:VWA domain-containing protein [Clostridia bacterium]
MTNLRLNFAHPWLLLLFIPAIALALFYHLRLAKRYRRTRNRIISLVLYGIVAALSVTVLSGFTVSYDKSNSEKELLLVVDLSYGNADRKEDKDAFVEAVLGDVGSAFRTGVVTFGYDQVYAAELSYDSREVFENYLNADRPDGSATDIASALSYARSLFTTPETAKIVLVSDGMQTDGSALSVIKSLVADGTKVDTVYFPSGKAGDEVQITGVELPDFNVAIGDTFTIEVTLQSSYAGSGYITVYDSGNAAQDDRAAIEFSAGVSTVTLEHVFAVPGMHEFTFTLECGADTEEKNNEYHSFFYVEIHENVLIVRRAEDDADLLSAILTEDRYRVTVVRSDDTENMPATLRELREYDQVVLFNIANADLPEGFDEILYQYVDEAGGGLFTVGGSKKDKNGKTVANAYDKEDMYYYDEQYKQTVATPYQQLLPVQSITYKPPVGVMIIIDRSGSMGATDSTTDKTLLDLAKEGSMECLKALDERDYFGVMTLSDSYDEAATINPVPKMHDIISIIDEIEIGGGTVFTGAIQEAGRALLALDKVQKRHIILVTDAMPGDSFDEYSAAIAHNFESGVTFSAIALNSSENYVEQLDMAAQLGGGRCYGINTANFYKIPDYMVSDLRVPEIQGYTPEEFVPIITGRTAVVSGVTQEEMPVLGGYYGT